MMILIYIFVVLLNIFFSFRKKNSKIVIALTVSYILLCVAGSVDNSDYYNYHEWYLGNWHPPTVESGYLFLSDFFAGIGLSYWGFLLLTQAFILGVVLFITYVYSKEYHIVLALYMSYQIFIDYVQRRNAIAVAFFVLAVYFLANNKKIIYAMLIICSFLIHKSMIIFLPFVFLNPNTKYSKRMVQLFTGALVISCIFLFANGNELPFLKTISRITSNSSILEGKFERYLTSKTRFGFLLPFFTYFINLLLAFISKNIVAFQLQDSDMKIKKYVNISYYFICISAFALPLVMINEEFIRYFRCCNILVYLMVSIVLMVCKKYRFKKLQISQRVKADYLTYCLVVVVNILSWIIIYTPNNVVKMFFETNMWIS